MASKSMRSTLKSFLLTAATIVLSVAAIAAQVSPEEQLTAAEARWAMDKPKVYEFTIRLYCFCPVLLLSREPIVFRVEGN